MSNEMMKLNDMMTLGNALADSKYFADAKEASQAIVKVLAGQELGIGPVAAMSGLYIVKGKVTLSGNVMASLIKSSSKYDYKIVVHSGQSCEIEFFEMGESAGVSEFTIEDAKQAGLANGENWKKYPRNMLFNRALSNGAKWYCPDLFNGQAVYVPEELDDISQNEPDFIIENPITTQISALKNVPANPQYENEAKIKQYLSGATGSPRDKLELVKEEVINGNLIWDEDITIAQIIKWSE